MKAPLFSLPNIYNDDIYHLKDDLGNIIVLTFWTSWCPDCGRDLPKKEQLYQSLDRKQVKMITINVTGREREGTAGVTYAEKFLTQLTLADRGREVYDLYQSSGVPTTIVIDSFGEIYDHFDDHANFLDIVQSVGSLLSEEN